MAAILETSQAASKRAWDLNSDSYDGIVYGYDPVSGGQALLVSPALAASFAADKLVRSDVEVLATLAVPCVLDCAGNPVAAPSTITITPGGLSPTFEVVGGPQFAWSFGDLTPEVIGNPVTHTFALAGTYQITAVPVVYSTCFGTGTTSATVA